MYVGIDYVSLLFITHCTTPTHMYSGHTLKYKHTKDTRSDLPSPERLEHKWIEVLWPCSFWWDDVS